MCKTHTCTQTTFSISNTTTRPEKPTQQSSSPPPYVQLTIDPPITHDIAASNDTLTLIKSNILPVIARFHAGYFHIALSLCMQTQLWKTLGDLPETDRAYRKMIIILMWTLSMIILVSLSILYILRCALLSHMVKLEYLNHISVNYLFVPSISWLFLFQSSPFFSSKTDYYLILFWVFVIPIFILDVKIYGQWFIKGKRFLSTVANPASQLSVVGNFVGAQAAAEMGWRESAVIMFSLGFIHYVVLFVTLYQRLSGNSCMPAMLRPVVFLFFGAPSMASLAWDSISGTFDCSSKMLFYLSVFLFLSLVSRPHLFKKSMKKFNVVWWAYSYPLTGLALASTKYAQEMKTDVAHLLMIILSGLSVLVFFILIIYTALNTNILLPQDGDDDNNDNIFMTLSLNTTNNNSLETLT